MDRGKFTREFKLDCAADQGSRRLMCAGVARFEFAIAQLGEGVCEGGMPFPGPEAAEREQQKISVLKRKSPARRSGISLLGEAIDMKFAFIATHRRCGQRRWLCGAARAPEGFYSHGRAVTAAGAMKNGAWRFA